MCAYRSIRSHRYRDRPRYVYCATRSVVPEPMSRVRPQPLLDQKRDLDFRFAAQISRGPSRGFCPPPLLNRGLDVANQVPPTWPSLLSQSVLLVPLSQYKLITATRTASGPQRTCRAEIAMSALPLNADIRRRHRDVSFGPKADICTVANLEKLSARR
jgi:hypothetical protein